MKNNIIEEFNMNCYYTRYNPTLSINLYGFEGSLKYITAEYRENRFIEFISKIKDILKDEWVEQNIELFDDSCNASCKWTYYNRYNNEFSPWYYVFESKSISQKLKNKYKDRPTKIKKFDDDSDMVKTAKVEKNKSLFDIICNKFCCKTNHI